MGNICTFHPRYDRSVFGQAVLSCRHPLSHTSRSPISPVQSPPLADQANDPHLRPRLVGLFAMITWKVKEGDDEGRSLSSAGE